FARARVAARASGARRNGERAEAHQRDRTALLERGLDSTDQGVKRTAGSSLGNISLAGDMIDEFGFVHSGLPLTVFGSVGRAAAFECGSRGRQAEERTSGMLLGTTKRNCKIAASRRLC